MLTSSQQIKLGAFLSYISITVNVITGLLYTPWMINSIGKDNYGLYTLAMSVISLFVFDFGLSVSINRYLSKYLAEGEYEKVNNCVGLVYRLYILIDIVLLVLLAILFLFIPDIYRELSADEIEKFKVVYVIAAIFSVLSFPFIPLNGILSAHEKFVELKSCEVFQKILIVGLMSICLILGYGLYALVLVHAISGIILILMKLFIIKKRTALHVNYRYWHKEEFKDIIGFSGWVTIMSLCQRSIFTLGPTILGAFSGSSAIAIFGVASTLESYVFTFSTALGGMFLPKISRILAGKGSILPLMIKVGRIQLILVTLIVGGFCCIGLPFIENWLGSNFSEAYICTVLIILPSILQLPQEIGDQALYATNKVRERSIAFIIMALVNLIIGIPLSSRYGATGLCFSICIAYMVRTIFLNVIYKIKLKIDLSVFFKETFVAFVPSLILIIALSVVIERYIILERWVGLIIKGLLFVLMYSIVIAKLFMNREEKGLIKNMANSVFNRNKLLDN